jgi:hypothetical protein
VSNFVFAVRDPPGRYASKSAARTSRGAHQIGSAPERRILAPRAKTHTRQRLKRCCSRVREADESAKPPAVSLGYGSVRHQECRKPETHPRMPSAQDNSCRRKGGHWTHSAAETVPRKIPREFQAAANQGVWPVEPAHRSGQGDQLMRIVPYESTAVKVRVQQSTAESGHFTQHQPQDTNSSVTLNRARPSRPVRDRPRQPLTDTRRRHQISKFCPKSRTRITDTDVERVPPAA